MRVETKRLILRSFREEDVDAMAQLFANPDFVRFSLGAFTERLHPDYWNRGLITEAARAVRDHGFADLKLPRVISLIPPENIPSRRVAEKNGMKVEKEITFREFPTLVYAVTREQWLANRDAS
jgi:RimJ/RimL family protein N-acetyltransferase